MFRDSLAEHVGSLKIDVMFFRILLEHLLVQGRMSMCLEINNKIELFFQEEMKQRYIEIVKGTSH